MNRLILASIFAFAAMTSVSYAKKNSSVKKAASDTSVSEDGSVSLSGKKASEMISLMESVKAVQQEDDPCEMNKCYAKGEITAVCKYPTSGRDDDGSVSCTISAKGKEKPVKILDGDKAKKMMTLLESAHATGTEDECGAGSCYQTSSIALDCKYPNGTTKDLKLDRYSCSITPVKASGSNGPSPRKADPPKTMRGGA